MRRIYTFLSGLALLLFWGRPVAAQDKVWGFTPQGGVNTIGSIFEVNPANNSVQSVYSLIPDTSNAGMAPSGRLTLYNGLLYGMTPQGGSSNAGVIFSYDPATGVYTVLHPFDNTHGGGAVGSLTVYNNLLYGVTRAGGANGFGVIFSYDPATGAYTDLFDFVSTSGSGPAASLIVYNNFLYGTTVTGGASSVGTVFRWDPATSTYSYLSLTSAVGSQPYGDLVAYNGLLYGTARTGGANRAGTIYSCAPDLSSATLRHTFTYLAPASPLKQGGSPEGSLVLFNNVLYGLTRGGPNAGANILFSFAPGSDPSGDVYMMKVTSGLGTVATYNSLIVYNSLLFGMGTDGTVFSYDPVAGGSTVTPLVTLTGSPASALTVYNNLLYGMLTNGGTAGNGEIFSVDPSSGTYQRQVSMNLVDVNNGAWLMNRPLAVGSLLYGATKQGGLYNKGILFVYDRSAGTMTKLVDLDGTNTGYQPGSLSIKDSVIYGWMQGGGLYNEGCLFSWSLRTNGPFKKLLDLGNPTDPNSSEGAMGSFVFLGTKLYYATQLGGTNGDGGVYAYDLTAGSQTMLYAFDASAYQSGGLVLADNGLLYGQMGVGGANHGGALYSVDPYTGTFADVYDLTAGSNSSVGDLAYRNDSLYGLTLGYPQALYGYSIANHSLTALHTFNATTDGTSYGSVVLSGSKVYGLAEGPDNVWQYDLNAGTFASSQALEHDPGLYYGMGIAVTSPLPQQIVFSDVTATYGDADGDPGARTSSNLPVIYTTGDPTIATIVGGKVHVIKSGTTTITASQAGNDAYLPAQNVTVNLTVRKATLQVTANDTSMVYGSVNTSRLSYYYTGFVNGQDSTVLLSQTVVSTDAVATSHVRSSNYTITPAGATAANYDFVYHTGVLFITPKPLVIRADDKQRLTGGPNPVFTATSSGFATADDSLALLPTIQFVLQPDGAAYAIVPSGIVSTDYQVSYVNGTLTEGSTTFQPVTGKRYGDADFVLSASAVGGETPVFSGDNPGVATVGADGTVHILHAGTVHLTADLGSAGRLSQTLTIVPATLVVTADDQLVHYGDPIPTLTLEYSGWVNGDGLGSLSMLPVAVTTATASSPGGIYPITVSGGSAADYQLVYAAGRLTISTLPWQSSTLTFDVLAGATYGNADLVPSVSSTNPDMPIVLTSSNAAVAVIENGNTVHLTGAGTVTITASQVGDISHTAAPDVSQVLTVAPATLIVTADNQTKAYGQPMPVLTLSYSGWVGSDGPSALTTTPAATVGANSATVPGVYPISAGGGVATNYVFQYVPGMLTITAAQAVITLPAPAVKTYGDGDFAVGAVSSNKTTALTYASGDVSVATVSSSGTIHIVGAGTTTITVSQAATADYAVAADVTAALVVQPAVLTITPDDKEKVQGQANPVFTFNYAGLVSGDDGSVLTVAPAAQTTADDGSLPGLYAITASGAVSNGNYTISYRTGSLRVIVDSSLHNDRLETWCSSPTSMEVDVFALAAQHATIQVYSLSGQPVVNQEVYLVNGDNHFSLPVSNLSPGMYVVRVVGQYLKLVQKIRITH